MITRIFSRAALHEHAEPQQRVMGAAELPPDSEELAQLLATDPAPEVRAAAARRCSDLAVLASAWETETQPEVRCAVAETLSDLLAETTDSTAARAVLEASHCTDAIRSAVARRTRDPERRHAALSVIRDEDPLVELALVAAQAETRIAAAERVHTTEGLRKLADAAKNRDNGVARLARQRIEAMTDKRQQEEDADSILAQLEALASKPGPILTSVVELNRRWQTLDMSHDSERLARCEAARQQIQARFDREHEEQRNRTRFDKKLHEWIDGLQSPAAPEAIAGVREELASLRDEAQRFDDTNALALLDGASARITGWEEQHRALADAETLVGEAEQLAAGTSIDDAKLPERWQALDRAIRTPELTRRFEGALLVVEQRRLAQIQAAQHEADALRLRVHNLLHNAEQALAAGQLQPVRTAIDEIKGIKAGARQLPKPTIARLSRVTQQLVELERWESFGQHNARVQLCERAEGLAGHTGDASQLAVEVQKLRNEWKTLDQQHAGVPKALWERFDKACEIAYAPAAKHFAELSTRRKEARKQREAFIEAAQAHVPSLLTDPPDWRAIERWLRETDHTWREGDLGSVEPGAWKKLDQRLKDVLAPLRDLLSAAREQGKSARRALISEANEFVAKASERETPSQVKAIQLRWQEQAKAFPLPQRDERALWEEFRSACDAVFNARHDKRKQEEGRKHEQRRGLEDVCLAMEALAQAKDKDDAEMRRALRDLQDQWKKSSGGKDGGSQAIESRFRNARTAIETLLSSRSKARENAVWRTLAAKERLCDDVDRVIANGSVPATAETAVPGDPEWSALPSLPAAWETRMRARFDEALRAVSDAAQADQRRKTMEDERRARSHLLLELETMLSLDSPPELQAERLAVQVKQLRERFQGGAPTSATAGERLVNWCAQSGALDQRDRKRADRVFAGIEKMR